MNKYDNISWDEYFMGIALLSSLRSKDPNTKVGACIVDDDNKVVSIGYNGMPAGLDEEQLSWNKGEGLDSKYLYVCHAEFNAILNTRNGASLRGCHLYVTLFPCNVQAELSIRSCIRIMSWSMLQEILRKSIRLWNLWRCAGRFDIPGKFIITVCAMDFLNSDISS